MGSTYSEQTD